jgi:hypothetical protein
VCSGKFSKAHTTPEERCPSRYAPAEQLDEIVWKDICEVLTHPESITDALRRAHGGEWLPQELKARQENLRQGRAALGRQLERLTEAYLGEVIPLAEYQRRREDLEQRDESLASQERQLQAQSRQRMQLAGVAGSIEDFCERVSGGLADATFEQRRKLVELLIDRVIVTGEEVEIRYVVPTDPSSEHVRFCHLRSDYLHHPPVTPQPLRTLHALPRYAPFDPALFERLGALRVVVGFVGVYFLGTLPRALYGFYGVEKLREEHRVVAVRARTHRGQRDALPVANNVALRARFALVRRIRSGFSAPFFAGTMVESKQARDQSIRSASPSRSSNARCKSSHTPASCHSRSRRQQVTPLPQPISCGSISHGMPLFSTKTMPVKAARSSVRGLPPSGLGGSFGRSGSMISQSSALTNSLAMLSTYPDKAVLKESLSISNLNEREDGFFRGCRHLAPMRGQERIAGRMPAPPENHLDQS